MRQAIRIADIRNCRKLQRQECPSRKQVEWFHRGFYPTRSCPRKCWWCRHSIEWRPEGQRPTRMSRWRLSNCRRHLNRLSLWDKSRARAWLHWEFAPQRLRAHSKTLLSETYDARRWDSRIGPPKDRYRWHRPWHFVQRFRPCARQSHQIGARDCRRNQASEFIESLSVTWGLFCARHVDAIL